ncbi:hypothetical protein [Lactiplantibacillus paraplantarum]|uniref:hypothetical protein n=1 Tax=Lactiplantibacillus paraplantarum TaxID=60520 RepID=UPI000AFF7EF6|nr:hypothetical protein [Lactiplantibacillus paraplantarum]
MQADSQVTKFLFVKNNNQFIKNWVRLCLPFEYCPDWKAFRPMPSGEIPLGKRFWLG